MLSYCIFWNGRVAQFLPTQAGPHALEIFKANTQANSKAFGRIPYETEQEIISAEQGILVQEQGI